MTHQVSGTLIEGIGDDLVVAVALMCIISIPVGYLLWSWWQTYGGGGVIHAESESLADDIRQQQQRNQQAQQTSTAASAIGGSNTASTSGDVNTGTNVRTPYDQQCPICIDNLRFAVQTNCSHIFCGQCFVSWWQHGRWTGSAKCPVCRQQVTLLLQKFSEEDRSNTSQMKQDLLEQISRYNRRFSGQPLAWHEYIRDLPTILRHCVSDFFSVGGLLWMFRLRIVMCIFIALLYLISPLDIIPEAVFGLFGLIDDLLVLLVLLVYVSIMYRAYVVMRPTSNHQHAE